MFSRVEPDTSMEKQTPGSAILAVTGGNGSTKRAVIVDA
jgi:hypothetical protein